MSQVRIESDGYSYATPEGWHDAQSVGYLPAILAAAEKFLELDKILEAIPDEGLTKYHNTVTVGHIMLEIEGIPFGQIMFLDDAPQFVPYRQESTTDG